MEHPRLIVLGASNVTRGLPVLMNAARGAFGDGFEIFVALGHGRSYGLDSRFLGRTLPGILHCDLWSALPADSAPVRASSRAVVCDVGNDLLYGVSAERLASWVEECLIRLRVRCAEVRLVRPPLARLATLGRWGFEVARRLFFPARPIGFHHALDGASELDQRLVGIAERLDVRTVTPPAAWYGADPIHITRRAQPRAWRDIVCPEGARREGSAVEEWTSQGGSLFESIALRTARPARVRFLGLGLGVAQPARRLRDGSLVHLF